MSHIVLNEVSYKSAKEENKSNLKYTNLDKLVDDISYELITKNPKLINDTEKKLIPITSLNNEINKYIDNNNIVLESKETRSELIQSIKDYLFGYRQIQPLIDDKDISDVKIINEKNVRIKVKGKRKRTNITFPSKKSLLTFAYQLAIRNNGNLSELSAVQVLTDKMHPNFIMRIDICIQPVNSESPSIVIRKHPKKKLILDDLVKLDMMDKAIKEYIQKAVKSGLKIIWCGKGASGKTTCMNACIEEIPENEDTLVMQESEELHSEHPGMIFQKVRYKTGESEIEYTLKDETINGLLMDLDRMIIGEIKGAEAMEFFNAIYTGHIGWTSIHAGNSMQALPKAVHLMKYSNTDLKRNELLEMLSSVDLIIFMKNFKCAEITEIKGFNHETKEVEYNPIFKFNIERECQGILEGNFVKLNDSCDRVKEQFRIHEFLN